MRFNRNDENYVYNFVGQNIKKYRKMRGYTQDELAEIVNYSPSFIANIESNTHQSFSLGALWRIATALGVSLNEICHDNKLGTNSLASVDYICNKCDYEFSMPTEVMDIFEVIQNVSRSKNLYPTFTCPKCEGKLTAKILSEKK